MCRKTKLLAVIFFIDWESIRTIEKLTTFTVTKYIFLFQIYMADEKNRMEELRIVGVTLDKQL